MIYINGIAGIYPAIPLNENGYHAAEEPDYGTILSPIQLRRMSRLMRMGLWAGISALRNSGVEMPDAIITATGLGPNEDTERFLRTYVGERGIGSPTAFIQSTHNAVGGQIALTLSCTGYNITYSQGTLSFESALMDADLLLRNESDTILCGAMDEVTPMMLDLFYQSSEHHFPAGEASVFYVLSSSPGEKTTAAIIALVIETFYASTFCVKCKRVFEQYNLNKTNTAIFTDLDISSMIPSQEDFLLIPVLTETGFFPTYTAVALQKAVDYLKEHQEHSHAAVIAADHNKNYRMILIQSFNLK